MIETTEVKNPISVLPASGGCKFILGLDSAGRNKVCPSKATIQLDKKPLCDYHASFAMTAACGRNTKIVRNGRNGRNGDELDSTG